MALSNSIRHPTCFNPITGKTNIAENQMSIQESLRLLLTTVPGELLGDPGYGTDLLSLLYEPNDLALIDVVKTNIVTSVTAYEPRITLTHNDITIGQRLSQLYIQLSYIVKNTGMRDTLVLQLAIREGY